MNNECGNKNGVWTCNEDRGHRGAHAELNRETYRYKATWPKRETPKPKTKPQCYANHTDEKSTYTCKLDRGHAGNHQHTASNGYLYKEWPKNYCRMEKDRFMCTLETGHTGKHEAWGTNGEECWLKWEREAKLKPFKPQTIFATDEDLKDAEELRKALGSAMLGKKPGEYSVLFTLEELKGLVYALSGPEWLEDEPELVAKIDKALKEAL